MRDHLAVIVNGKLLHVDAADMMLSVSDFLRKSRRLTGTKVVCAEGDCGACAVLVGSVTSTGTAIGYRTVASCIAMMFQLDGMHIVTVEGLSRPDQLNPIQQAMVKGHGAQCGFCTPGFVVSLYGLMQNGAPLDSRHVRAGLVGNLCRCTGYDSIVRSALETDRSQLLGLDTLYPTSSLLPAMLKLSAEPVECVSDDLSFFKPISVEQAVDFRQRHPDSLIVSGGTDLGVQRNKGARVLKTVLSTAGVAALQQVTTEADAIVVGAAVSLTTLEKVTAGPIPELATFLAWFGSPMIKNAGTIAGNLVNASPIGDTIPALTVLGASVELTGPAGPRWVRLADFYTGYRQTVLGADELLTRVRIPFPPAGFLFRLYKVSKRKDLDISSVSMAILMHATREAITQVTIAAGGVAATVVRLLQTETALLNQPPSPAVFAQAAVAARDEVKPIGDVRGSADYRKQLVHNLILKVGHELQEFHQAAPADDDGQAALSLMNR